MSKYDDLRSMREANVAAPKRIVEPRLAKRTRGVDAVGSNDGGPAASSKGAVRAQSSKVSRRGRPRIEEKAKTLTAQKPWLALGMSRATWYSRQAEKRNAS